MMIYTNLMMLLMTFFIVLVSASPMKKEKFKLVTDFFTESLATGGRGILWGKRLSLDFDHLIEQARREIREEISAAFRQVLGKDRELEILTTEAGVVIRLSGQISFELGKAKLRIEAQTILDKVVPLLKEHSHPVHVEGHTDNLPIHSEEFTSNWELSAVRAINVVKYLQNKGISKDRLVAAGYGEYRPLAANDTPEHRALNRRVEIVVIISST